MDVGSWAPRLTGAETGRCETRATKRWTSARGRRGSLVLALVGAAYRMADSVAQMTGMADTA